MIGVIPSLSSLSWVLSRKCFTRMISVRLCGPARVNWLTLWLCLMSRTLTLVYNFQSAQHGFITRGAFRVGKTNAGFRHERAELLRTMSVREKPAVATPLSHPLPWDRRKADGEWLKKRQNKDEKNSRTSRIMGLSAGWVVRIHLHGVIQGKVCWWRKGINKDWRRC